MQTDASPPRRYTRRPAAHWATMVSGLWLFVSATLAAAHDPPPLPSDYASTQSPGVIQAQPIPADLRPSSALFAPAPVVRHPVAKPPETDGRGGASPVRPETPRPSVPLLDTWLEPSQAKSSLKTMALLSVISLAPAIALMTTSYVRVAIVLTLLRQGLGAQGLPSNQMISALAMFISVAVMSPVWTAVYRDAIVPYTDPASEMELEEALQIGIGPVREFMQNQIVRLGNTQDIMLFCQYLPEGESSPTTVEEAPLSALLPAFMLSELKTAFLIGFQVYLPFLILDILVASVTVSMGMFMLPPAYVSLPFKLLLFVMVDGWHLLVDMLLKSFAV